RGTNCQQFWQTRLDGNLESVGPLSAILTSYILLLRSCTPRPGDRAIGPGKRLRRWARRAPRAPVRDPQLRISTRGGKDTGSPLVYFLAHSLNSITPRGGAALLLSSGRHRASATLPLRPSF